MEWLRRILGLRPGALERTRLEAEARADGEEMVRLATAGDFAGALRVVERTLPLLRRLWAFVDLSRAHNNAGDLAMQLGRLRYALHHFRKALKLWKKIGDDRGQALSHAGIAKVLMQAEQHDRARRELRRACDLFASAGDDRGLADALDDLVNAYRELGLHEEQRDAARELADVAKRLGDDERLSRALQFRAMAEQDLGEHAASVVTLQSAWPLLKTDDDRIGVLQGLADGYAAQSLFTEALESSSDAIALAEKVGDPARVGRLLSHRGVVQSQAGLSADALRSFEEALSLVTEPREKAQVLMNLASWHLREADYDRAKEYADRANDIFEALQDYPGALGALQLHARAAQRQREEARC